MGAGLLIALAVSIVIFAVLLHLLRKIMPLILHGVAGMIIFWIIGYAGIIKVPLDIVTFLIAAFGGVLGVATVLLLAAFGVPL
jgi:inhibitor of the pro-sigma K processing machinery